MQNIKAFVITAIVFFSGCKSTENFGNMLTAYEGKDISDIFQVWGAPTKTFEAPNGDVIYTYDFDAGAVAVPIGNMVYAANRGCEVNFITSEEGIIKSHSFSGNNCKI